MSSDVAGIKLSDIPQLRATQSAHVLTASAHKMRKPISGNAVNTWQWRVGVLLSCCTSCCDKVP